MQKPINDWQAFIITKVSQDNMLRPALAYLWHAFYKQT